MTVQNQLQQRSSSSAIAVILLIIFHQSISSLLLCQSFQQQPFLTRSLSSDTSSSRRYPSISSSSSFISSSFRRSFSTHFYADPSVHDETVPAPPVSPSFEQRMREQLKQRQIERRQEKWQQQPPPKSTSSTSTTETRKTRTALIPDVRNLEEYKNVLDQASEDKKMVAVFWYSPWCKACKAASPGIKTIAKHHPDIQFIQVPVLEENAVLHQGLNVPSVPYMHLYTPDDPRLVEERKMTRKKLSGFQKLLQDYEDGSCSLDRMNDEWSISNPYSFPSSNSNASTTISTRSRSNNNSPNMMGKVGVVSP